MKKQENHIQDVFANGIQHLNTVDSKMLQSEMDVKSFISAPLSGVLHGIGFGEHDNFRYFQTHTFFWSMVRLFGCYERVMSVLELERSERPFLEADIESFIIRFQIVLNDIAYIVRQILPANARKIAGIRNKGGRLPENHEMSMNDLLKSFREGGEQYPEFKHALNDASDWMLKLRDDRNKVVHYKAKVVVFEFDSPSFAFHDAAGPEHVEQTNEGGQRVVTVPVGTFINGQMLSLHNFLQVTLVEAIQGYAHRTGIRIVEVGKDHRMSAIGVARFKRLNALP
ncbi:MAG TPA: hypothetical protein PLW14_06465 [Chlorobiota bacterium]|nr:hypothetical protein [Chlorobiota bacterium]